jgi:hypothetical protein
MFLETIVQPRGEWERWTQRLRLLTEPPEALVAMIAWDSGDGEVTEVNVWETPGAIAGFFMGESGRSWRRRVNHPTSPNDTASRSRYTFGDSFACTTCRQMLGAGQLAGRPVGRSDGPMPSMGNIL